MKINALSAIMLFIYFTMLIFVKPAYGYIDSGTGSMLIQVIIAALTAAGVFLGMARHRIRKFFQGVFGKKKDQDEVKP